jgi:hypothetical protein
VGCLDFAPLRFYMLSLPTVIFTVVKLLVTLRVVIC